MIGDIHPNFPLLYVSAESEDGKPLAYATKGECFSLDDPRLVLMDRAGRQLAHHREHIGEPCGRLDTPAA